MYNRPIYMREGGYASSFGSGINPSFGNNGVLENIQEQVSNNGDVLRSMQGGMNGSPFSPIMERPGPTVPEGIFQNPGMDYSQFKPQMLKLLDNPFMRPENMMGSPINPVKEAEMMKAQANAITNDFSGMTFEQAQGRQQQRDIKSPEEAKAIADAIARGPTGNYGNVGNTRMAGPLDHTAVAQDPNVGSSMQGMFNIPGMGDTPRSYGVQVSPNNLTNQPTNSGTDSFPSGMLQNEMFGNMGRLQNIQQFANGGLADMGRFGDNQMVHAQTGEMVVPQSILQENPQIGMGLNQALVNQGLDPQRQVVGSGAGSINPMTGQQEFFDLGKILKTVAPIVISAYLGPAAGAGLGSMFGAGTAGASFMSNPFVGRAITGALTSKLTGGSNKDALKNALLSGVSGAAFDGFSGSGSGSEVGANFGTGSGSGNVNMGGSPGGKGYASVPSSGVSGGSSGVQAPARTFSGELLKSIGVGDDNIFSKLMNTQMGEGLTAGLIAQLLAGNDKEEDQRSEYERRPFGYGGPGGKLGGITYANMGGPMGFPRRNGGIDPNEGSGRKDDVPAMLMAGEFVLTKDAIKGLGNGNQRQGIQKAYDMMENLEARA
jgi:hypothetical protein